MIPIYTGFDPREAMGYHVFCQSVIQNASEPVCFIPLAEPLLGVDGRRDGSNAFIYSRFLAPFLNDYKGWAIFADGADMLCRDNIADLWALRDGMIGRAVCVVKNSYTTRYPVKYLGAPNPDYPRKNWSSLMLMFCGHSAWRKINPKTLAKMSGRQLHRFEFLTDSQIGNLPIEWNWLVGEYPANEQASLYHFTLGIPPLFRIGNQHTSAAEREWDAMLKAIST